MKTKLLIFTIIITTCLGVALLAVQQIRIANRAVEQERLKIQTRDSVTVMRRTIHLRPNTHSRLFSASTQLRDITQLRERLYAATNKGILILTLNGELLEHWTPVEGLPSSEITTAAVLDNSVWFGTRDAGLITSDGSSWEQILFDNKSGAVTSLLATKQGTLLIGTESGLMQYRAGIFSWPHPSLRGVSVTSLGGDLHRLAVGTRQNGLYIVQGGRLRHFDRSNGLKDLLITQVESNGDRWLLSTPSGLQELHEESFREILKNIFVTSFFVDGNTLWTASYDRGIFQFRYAASEKIARQTPARRFEAGRSPLLRKIDRNLFAFSTSGSWTLEKAEWQPWPIEEGMLTDENISALLKRENGQLWVGYFDKGIDILDSDLKKIRHREDSTIFCVNHLSEDKSGTLYVSTANGLLVQQRHGAESIYTQQDGLLSSRVMQAVPLDDAGSRVAIATSQGFTLKEGTHMKSIFAFHGLVNNHVYSLAASGDQLYLGTLGGISRVTGLEVLNNWTQSNSGLKRNWVNALLVVNGRLIVGTYGSGIQSRNETGHWQEFPELPADLEINPNAFYFDGRYLFCGTLDRGFYYYDVSRNRWKHYATHLPGLNVTAFAADSRSLFVGTTKGLLQISYDEIHTIPDLS